MKQATKKISGANSTEGLKVNDGMVLPYSQTYPKKFQGQKTPNR